MAGKIGQKDGTSAFPVETLPFGGQVFTECWAKKRIWRKKHEFVNSNIKICREIKWM